MSGIVGKSVSTEQQRVNAAVDAVTNEVANEAYRAIELHRPMCSCHEAAAVILEEYDEFWDLVKLNPKKMTDEFRAQWKKNLRMELTQTAAMCVRTIIDCDL